MLGGVATICGVCSYRWIVSPAVARSYRCPECQGAWGDPVAGNACTCSHTYGEHRDRCALPASRAAFGIKASEAHLLPKILVPAASGLRAEIFDAMMVANQKMSLTKFVKSSGLYLEFEYRLEHLDGGTVSNFFGLAVEQAKSTTHDSSASSRAIRFWMRLKS